MLTEFEAMESNLRQSFRALAAERSRGRVTELPGVTIASLGVAFQMFNAAFLSRPVETVAELRGRLIAAEDFFAGRGHAWSFWIGEEWLARPVRRGLVDACETFGLRAVAEMTGMSAHGLKEARRTAPALEIRRVDSPAEMEEFRAVGSVCFHVPPVWFAEVFDDAMLRREFACWVGYRGGAAVATAATVISEEAVGVYNVATVPEARGRGFAEAITRHAVAQAMGETALQRVILQSTSQGERLYRRLGFRDASAVVVFNSTR